MKSTEQKARTLVIIAHDTRMLAISTLQVVRILLMSDLMTESVFSDSELSRVSPVEAVNAVRPDDTVLVSIRISLAVSCIETRLVYTLL